VTGWGGKHKWKRAIYTDFLTLPNYKEDRALLFLIDSRNKQSVEFVTFTQSYIEEYKLNIGVRVIFTNDINTNSFKNFIIGEKILKKKYKLKNDSYYYIDNNGYIIKSGEAYSQTDSFTDMINPMSTIESSHMFERFIDEINMLSDIKFAGKLNDINNNGIACITFFEYLCDCNDSIKYLDNLNNINTIKNIFVIMNDYTKKEIDILKSNKEYSIEFIIADKNMIKEWRKYNPYMKRYHPFEGLLLLIDSRGYVMHKSKDLKAINLLVQSISK